MFSKNPGLCPIIAVQNLVLQCMMIVANRRNLFYDNHKLLEENILSAEIRGTSIITVSFSHLCVYPPYSLTRPHHCLPSLC